MMRWLKHLSATWDDEKIADMVADGGLEIYGFWWRILEIIAKQMTGSSGATCCYPVKVWARFAGISPKTFRKFSKILEEKKLINLKNSENNFTITVDNLLKYRDEYTSRNK